MSHRTHWEGRALVGTDRLESRAGQPRNMARLMALAMAW
jgi:hypothetical protein